MFSGKEEYLVKNQISKIIVVAIAIVATSFLGPASYSAWLFVGIMWMVYFLQNNFLEPKISLNLFYWILLPVWIVLGGMIIWLTPYVDGDKLVAIVYPSTFMGIVWFSLFIWDKFLPASKSLKSFYGIVQIIWLIIFAVLCYFFWPADLYFAIFIIPGWLFLGVAWFWVFVFQMRWWSLLGIFISFPTVVFILFIATIRLNDWATERQLDRFITNASDGKIIENIELSAYGGVKIADFMADSTADYEIMYLDTLLFGADEYRIDFTTGVTYHVSIHGPLEDGHWYIDLDTWHYD